MHPGPDDVRAWFAVEMAGETLTAHVATLQADRNWRVLSLPGSATWTLNLVYWPSGEQLEIVLHRVGRMWLVPS